MKKLAQDLSYPQEVPGEESCFFRKGRKDRSDRDSALPRLLLFAEYKISGDR